MSDNLLTEEELEYLFSNKKNKIRLIIPYLKWIFLSILSIVIIFGSINFQSIKAKLIFWYEYEYNDTSSSTTAEPIPENKTNHTAKTNDVVIKETVTKPQMDSIEDGHLYIKTINVNAPIIWNVPNNQKSTSEGLQNGLIHIENTAFPGQVGNVFITGHSSNYPWAKGQYNNIFALLDKLTVGDKIQLKYQNQDFLYKVKEVKVVQPTDTSVLQPTADSVLTLMTCTPVGTSLRRLIVISDQVYPNPENNTIIDRTATQNSQVRGVR